MGTEDKVVEQFEGLLENVGYTLSGMINLLGKKNSKLLMLKDDDYEAYVTLYETIKNGNLTKGEKGKRLEELASLLFDKSVSAFFDVYRNCHTSTNEIDILVRWTDNARIVGVDSAFPCFGDSFLCECKNYGGKVDVTYVGKFCYLMNVTNTNLGIMVSWEGVSGRGKWSDSRGLIKKVALKENKYIVVLDKNDLERIYKKETNIFSIINDKYLALKNEIDYTQYILKHDAEESLQ